MSTISSNKLRSMPRRRMHTSSRAELQTAMLQVEHNMQFEAALAAVTDGQFGLSRIDTALISDRSSPTLASGTNTTAGAACATTKKKKTPPQARRRQSLHQPSLLSADFSAAVDAVAEVSPRNTCMTRADPSPLTACVGEQEEEEKGAELTSCQKFGAHCDLGFDLMIEGSEARMDDDQSDVSDAPAPAATSAAIPSHADRFWRLQDEAVHEDVEGSRAHCEMAFDVVAGPDNYTRYFLRLAPEPEANATPSPKPARTRVKLTKQEKMSMMKRMGEKRSSVSSDTSETSDPDDGGVESPCCEGDPELERSRRHRPCWMRPPLGGATQTSVVSRRLELALSVCVWLGPMDKTEVWMRESYFCCSSQQQLAAAAAAAAAALAHHLLLLTAHRCQLRNRSKVVS